ncbi:protein POLAR LOCALIZATION DURING ASYMMETRIC DIVISION AND REDISTRIBUTION-like [Impatiens glandulifera]|uniref:protein POLAR LOCALIZATION DURING ASYMMETRIC DIVISION AND REDISTRIBUTION-like n=1 Tax=Impatiens glandulifera TaxID=253017 RepID=UPI001FB06702|nr:protein POLAR LOCALIZATION DURING ASYMMETRIC DIVISION AND REDISTRIBUTION-like [Impatiens glandulifera]
MQIADILISNEDDVNIGGGGSTRTYYAHQHRCGSKRWKRRRRMVAVIHNNVCLAPKFLISRLMSSARKLRGRSQTKNGGMERERESKRGRSLGSVVKREREDDDDDDNMQNSSVKVCDDKVLPIHTAENAKVDCENLEESGQNRNITYFNLAIGFCLVHLIVSSKKELSERPKLRKKVELVNAKEKFKNEHSSMLYSLTESNDISHYTSTTDAKENTTIDNLIGNPLALETTGLCDQSLASTRTTEGNSVGRMDQLETEMEFELERLQLFLDMEDASDHPNQQKTEKLLEDSSCEGSSTMASFRKAIDNPKTTDTYSGGVNPTELDIKLRELLEIRQEERIKELETALNNARQDLYEKEQELCWWKDTAKYK